MKILVVDDEELLVKGIRFNLQNEGYEVITGTNGLEAVTAAKNQNPNLIVLDVMMPEVDGFELAQSIRENDSNVPILFISAKDEFEAKKQSFLLGVDDYMVKPIDVNELILRVGALLRRTKINKEKKLKIKNTIIDTETLKLYKDGEEIDFSSKEFKILFKLLSNPNKIFTRTQIITDCFGMFSESTDRTIDVHINHIREKLANNDDFKIVTIRGLGYKAVTFDE
jgi:DNA-binding response OmpR family regulator